MVLVIISISAGLQGSAVTRARASSAELPFLVEGMRGDTDGRRTEGFTTTLLFQTTPNSFRESSTNLSTSEMSMLVYPFAILRLSSAFALMIILALNSLIS